MNYQAHYDRLIDRAQTRNLEGYVERHHVIPRCMGGGDEIENIVVLTAEEHLVAHLFLIKINPGNYKLVYAANMMNMDAHGGRKNNKRYAWFRRRFAEASRVMNTGKVQSAETCAKKSAATKGKPKTPEHKQKISVANMGEKNAMFGKTRSAKTRAKTTASLLARHFHHTAKARARIGTATSARLAKEDHTGVNNSFFGKHHTPEAKAKLAAAHIGLVPSLETRAKISAAGMGRKPTDETRAKLSASLKAAWKAKKEKLSCQVQ